MKPSRIFLSLLLFSIAICALFTQEDRAIIVRQTTGNASNTKGETFALLIGINKYDSTDIKNLNFCVQDVKRMAETLKSMGVPEENIVLMHDEAAENMKPTRNRILRQLIVTLGKLTKDDRLIFGFSGHGAQSPENQPSRKAYLVPADGYNSMSITLIDREEVFDMIDKCPAIKKLALIDACRAEMFDLNSRSTGMTVLTDPIGEFDYGFAVIASCRPDQYSYEDKNLQHGVFTHFVIKGLEGEAWNKDGSLTLDELFQYVMRNTRNHVVNVMRKDPQIPTRGGDYSEFVIKGKGNTGNVQDQPQPPSVLPQPTSPLVQIQPQPTDQGGKQAGERMVFTIKGVEYPFRWCPPGTFMMGSPKSEVGRGDDETQHQVTLTRGFWMLETEVTQLMWESVMANNPSRFKGSKKLPVEQVSWDDCQEFIKKLNSLLSTLKDVPAGSKVSLPTEAQWEYACRAGTATSFHFGSVLNGDKANCDGNYPYGTELKGQYLSKTSEVGSYPVNAWGLYDMHGNVWEWCLDCYGTYPSGSVTDPVGASTESSRVLRGGSWYFGTRHCRSAFRYDSDPSSRYFHIGLRLSLVHEE